MKYGLQALIFLTYIVIYINGYNIAFHAQVVPSKEKVVGSVITTDGLLNAFKKRPNVDSVKVFYPSNYRGYADVRWDFLFIEGWFPSIVEFIQISRNLLPDIVIIFYCLDPTFPGLDAVFEFDVDGILTNSRLLYQQLVERNMPTAYVMLAADPDIMKPNNSVPRSWGTIYIGAGGFMLEEKPELFTMLLEATKFNLRLNGAGWERVDAFKAYSQGPLPRYGIANAYSSAQVVLGSTIQSQDRYGMINNRIFEALSCGSVFVTKYSPTLEAVFGDLIQYYDDTKPFNTVMNALLSNDAYTTTIRQRAREFILQGHTWDHRAIEIEDFLLSLQATKNASRYIHRPYRTNHLRVLWIASNHLQEHLDYVWMVNYYFRDIFQKQFQVDEMKEEELLAWIENKCMVEEYLLECMEWLGQYDVLFAVISPNDDLDLMIRSLPATVLVGGRIQRRAAYLLGYDAFYLDRCRQALSREYCSDFRHYDMIFLRDFYDAGVLVDQGFDVHHLRIQQSYGIGYNRSVAKVSQLTIDDIATVPLDIPVVELQQHALPLILCFSFAKELCTNENRQHTLLQALKHQFQNNSSDAFIPHRVILFGASWQDWLNAGNVVDYKMISFMHHVESHHIRADLNEFFEQTSVILIQQPYHAIQRMEGDAIFPFIAAARQLLPVHLYSLNEHILNLSKTNCNEWEGLTSLTTIVNTGLNRMFGFPPARISATLTPLILHNANGEDPFSIHTRHMNINLEELYCLNCHPTADHLLTASGYVRYLLAHMTVPFAIVSLKYGEYHVGRDMQLCMIREGDSEDDMLCMLRDALYVLVTQKYSSREIENIEIKIRGNFFGDFTYHNHFQVTQFLIPQPNPTEAQDLASRIDQKAFGVLRDNIIEFSL